MKMSPRARTRPRPTSPSSARVCPPPRSGVHAPRYSPVATTARMPTRRRARREKGGVAGQERNRVLDFGVVDAATHRASQPSTATRPRSRPRPPAGIEGPRGRARTCRSPQPLPPCGTRHPAASFSMLSPSRIVTSCAAPAGAEERSRRSDIRRRDDGAEHEAAARGVRGSRGAPPRRPRRSRTARVQRRSLVAAASGTAPRDERETGPVDWAGHVLS